MRDFTHADYCAWCQAYVIDDTGKPERVSAHWSTWLPGSDRRVRFRRASGLWEEANLSENRLKTDGTTKS